MNAKVPDVPNEIVNSNNQFCSVDKQFVALHSKIDNSSNNLKLYISQTIKREYGISKIKLETTASSVYNLTLRLSLIQSNQNYIKKSIDNLHSLQNYVNNFIDEVKAASLGCTADQKFSSFDEKFENLENHFADFEMKPVEKFENIQNEMTINRHKISVSFDDKFQGIEKRLMKKFVEMLEEKLTNILHEKLGQVIDVRFGHA